MAISSSKFVNANSTVVPEAAVSRDFSGLVISSGTPKDATTGIGKSYTDGDVVSVNINTLSTLFDSAQPEYKWAVNYFAFLSPSGTIPARLKFLKLGASEEAVDAFKRAIGSTETFGSFTFLSGETTGVSDATKLKAAATYNVGLNYAYRMVVDYSQTSTDANFYENYVKKTSGVIGGDLWDVAGLTLCNNCSFMTMARLAATDYTGTNTTSCDMFKSVSGVSATVLDDTTYATLTELRLNFIGLVREHGNQWNWYMRGYNMDGTDTACYDNEMWFKSEIIKDLLSLEDRLEKIPANDTGLSYVKLTILDSVNMALQNGTILPGKTLSTEKQQQVIAMTGSDAIIDQLNRYGYYLYTWMTQDGEDYIINYQIIYLKGDAVRQINGTHVIA